MTVHHNFQARSGSDIQARAREIRADLPGQLRQQRLSTAALLYGPLCSMDELRARIAHSIPRSFGSVRLTRWEPIEATQIVIPDEILVTYDNARELGLFSRFMVARAAYYWAPQPNPWLVAEVEGTERWAAITRWEEDSRQGADAQVIK